MLNRYLASVGLLLTSMFLSNAAAAAPEFNERYVKRLFEMAAHPERTGNPHRIFIVDGFRDVDVDKFINTHFDSIENVMFTSVIVTDQQGKPLRDKTTGRIKVEDDGC